MIWTIKSAHNKCIEQWIEFWCCTSSCGIIITKFVWRWHERENTSFWNITTCMKNKAKIVTIGFSVVSMDNRTRTVNRKLLEKVFWNYSCCDDCCPLRIEFTDDDWEEYYFEAKIWSEIVSDNINGSNVWLTYEYSLEVCWNKFINLKENEVCWILWKAWWISLPSCSWQLCTACYIWSEIISYEWWTCWDYKIEIKANNLVNPMFHNFKTKWKYWLTWTFNWKVIIDTQKWVFLNWNYIAPNQRTVWSNLSKLKLTPWDNEVLLTSYSWEAEYCIYYSNNLN